jgi:hypothetical protein
VSSVHLPTLAWAIVAVFLVVIVYHLAIARTRG